MILPAFGKTPLTSIIAPMKKEKKEEKKEKILEYLERLPCYKWSASSVGINEATLKRWRDEDPEFNKQCDVSRAKGVLHYGRQASPEFILKAIDPATFSQNRLEVEVKRPIPILGNITDDVREEEEEKTS